ncbi:hypothetical protein Cpir12675_005655 [Ceratocystis pirilliformis]|uniref:ATP-dependent RNA helicase DHX35 n=1 Tax=Ceratocystis pirilliformis TaxID=259994 RepID=A0ABR3YPG5_9PEZI
MADFDLDSSFIPALHKPAALLPITKHHDSILYVIETYPVTIIIGQTGSGKTTQIPQFLYHGGWCNNGKAIAITQPRRVSATTISMRVAQEFGCPVGKEVGYAVRFEDVTSQATRIKFMTDGLLIREALMDPLLSKYSVIMVDEAHERSISTDILLGLLKKIRRKRPELRIIISSATIQADLFLRFFETLPNGAPDEKSNTPKTPIGRIVNIEGRTFPVKTFYLNQPTEDYVEKSVQTVLELHSSEGVGDILVFLTGRDEINKAVDTVLESAERLSKDTRKLMALPLYAGLSSELQMLIFDKTPPDTRKVIFATNIAEASLTIDGIVHVIDCGFAKQRFFTPNTRIETLTRVPISKASAAQRAGRAGRTQPGKCFRLYTEASFDELPESNIPEIQRTNLAPIVLQLKALGIDNVARFDFLSPPPAVQMAAALELLHGLTALDDYAKLTRPLGLQMAELSLDPMTARALLAAPDYGCLSEMLTIAAMTSLGGNVWIVLENERHEMEEVRRLFAADEGDHLTLLNVYTAFVTVGRRDSKFCHSHRLNFKSLVKAISVRIQLKRMLEQFNISVNEPSYLSALMTSSSVSDNRGRKTIPLPSRPSAAEAKAKSEKIRRCLTAGFFANAAKMQPDGTFHSVTGLVFYPHPNSLMFGRKADWVIFHEVLETSNKTYIRDVSKVEMDWLVQAAPGFYQVKSAS